jgi:thiamine transport system substrate-binding protein
VVVGKYRFLIFGLLCLAGLVVMSRRRSSLVHSPDLLVYSYSSFSASWGPGPILKEMFEAQCNCTVQIRDADDSRLLLQRLKMESARVKADVVLGLNQWDVDEAVDELGLLPVAWDDSNFFPAVRAVIAKTDLLVPFDWGILAFNTKNKSEMTAATSLTAFRQKLPQKSLALQDPRTSAPGLSFLLWLVQVMGEEKAFLFF